MEKLNQYSLMAGDWVRNDLGEYQTVVELRESGAMLAYNDIYPYDEIDPIPLTPEILEKNGFSGEGYCMGVTGFMKEAIPGEKDGYEVWIWKDMCLQIKHGFTHYKKYIKYVHELQHALRMCDIDKEITI